MTFDQLMDFYGRKDNGIQNSIDEVWADLERSAYPEPKDTGSKDWELWKDQISNAIARRIGLGEYAPVLKTEYEDAIAAQDIYSKVK
jgi:hypothetical protein